MATTPADFEQQMSNVSDDAGASVSNGSTNSGATGSSGKQSSSIDHSSSCDVSSTGGGSSSGASSSGFGSSCFHEEFAAKETRNVRRSRFTFLVILFLVASAAGVVTYLLTSRGETEDFKTEFHDIGYEVTTSTNLNAQQQAIDLHTFGMFTTSMAIAENATWPEFSYVNFHEHAQQYVDTAHAETFFIAPAVKEEQKVAWNEYSATHTDWYQEGLGSFKGIFLPIHADVNLEAIVEDDNITHYLPLWQTYPTPDNRDAINHDLIEFEFFNRIFHYMLETGEPVLSETITKDGFYGNLIQCGQEDAYNDATSPHVFLIQPIWQELEGDDREVVAVIGAIFEFNVYLANVLHEGANGVHTVIHNSCGDVYTFLLNGPEAEFVGFGDLHQEEYGSYVQVYDFEPFPWHSEKEDASEINCHYRLYIYPTDVIYDTYHTNKPLVLTITVVLIFLLTSLAFLVYDRLVQVRQAKVMDRAQRTNAIVSSLFPAEVRDRLFKHKTKKNLKKSKLVSLPEGPKFRLKTFLNDEHTAAETADHSKKADNKKGLEEMEADAPIADLFPNVTVMFADIAGFTAWSSVREPAQVFTLLETVYRSFDHIAKRRRVFKVETIGDCYVAVAGLPEAREDHAVVMARFARECLMKMNDVTKKLEVKLGPETGDLCMRFGLHTGPVTAGVLRGEKSRFQLFGDTVNTAARMESTGTKNRIQCSEETAEQLRIHGKERWLQTREDLVVAKGKGHLRTYWIQSKDDANEKKNGSVIGDEVSGCVDDILNENGQVIPESTGHIQGAGVSPKNERLAGWISELLLLLLKQLVASRPKKRITGEERQAIVLLEEAIMSDQRTVLEETPPFVPLPQFEDDFVGCSVEDVKLDPLVEQQLRQYVLAIASMYRDNPFHCFEHCAHVTMSVRKLLARIVSPENPIHNGQQVDLRLSVNDRTYGITSDKMAQFAVTFAALIHDVDHRGIPNFILVKEHPEMATRYKGKAVAEQNSVDLGWEVLMSPEFKELRDCIYTTKDELLRFRELIVNTIMATDIFDPDLARNRKERWARAFEHQSDGPRTLEDVSRKSTIVTEHLIQASDVAHTMQHWQVYIKWNERLFTEMYSSFKHGRMEKDPSLGWYNGELGFMDGYVIPLAMKLKECQVFGVSSDEYLNYALQNRQEWERRGQEMVQDFLKRFKQS